MGVVDGHPEVFVYLTPRDVHFLNISILCVNVRKNARDNVRIKMRNLHVVNMTEYGALFIFDNFFITH